MLFFLNVSCNKPPYSPPYLVGVGYVIAKETCKNDDLKEYWLIEIQSVATATQQYGDSLTIGGIKYTNVVKSTGLADTLKRIGRKIGFYFTVSPAAVTTNGCIAVNPITYQLREAFIVSSAEAR